MMTFVINNEWSGQAPTSTDMLVKKCIARKKRVDE